MRAVAFSRYGGPDVLEAMELDDPAPGHGDAVIRLRYTSVNNLDILVRNGRHGLLLPMPHVPGADVVGRIEKLGSGVKGFEVGDFVVANTVMGCGDCTACNSGDEISCSKWKAVGLHVWGSYAELVKLPSRILVKAPKGFNEEELSTMPLSLGAAWRSLNVLGRARPGETVVIRGASGNVGLFLLSISKKMGLKAIALSRSKWKREKLRLMGADETIDSSKPGADAVKEVMEMTDGRGADIVIESTGSTLMDSIAMSAQGGRVIVFGTSAGLKSSVDVMPLYLKGVQVLGTHNTNMQDIEAALAYMSKNGIKPVIAERMPMTEAGKAHTKRQNSECFGKIILHW